MTHETAETVLDAIISDAEGDSVRMFLDWHGISQADYQDVVYMLYRTIDMLPSAGDGADGDDTESP